MSADVTTAHLHLRRRVRPAMNPRREVMMSEGQAIGGDEPLERGRDRRYVAMSDRALVDAMRGRDGAAVAEFIARFQHLVFVQARRLLVPAGERRRWALDLLVEVAASLARRRADAPRALAPYLVTACKRKMLAERRQLLERARLEREQSVEIGGGDERAIPGACSESSVRATHGPGWEPETLPEGLVRLVAMLDAHMDPGERQLLSWMAHRVPYATIATWLGITRSAAVKRGTRLRARLVDLVLRIGASMEPQSRRDVLRMLRRTQRFDERELRRFEQRESDGDRRVAESAMTYALDDEGNERGDDGTR